MSARLASEASATADDRQASFCVFMYAMWRDILDAGLSRCPSALSCATKTDKIMVTCFIILSLIGLILTIVVLGSCILGTLRPNNHIVSKIFWPSLFSLSIVGFIISLLNFVILMIG